jgi:hypothetical protein
MSEDIDYGLPQADRKEKNEQKPGEGLSLVDVFRACSDSRGYVIFVARLEPVPDEQGNLIVEHGYLRQNFSFEDIRDSFKHFITMYQNDTKPEAF